MRTMMVKKDELVVTDFKKRMAEEIVVKAVKELKIAMNDLGDQNDGIEVPEWC